MKNKFTNQILPFSILWRLMFPLSLILFAIIITASALLFLQHKSWVNEKLNLISARVACAFNAEVEDLAESFDFALTSIASNDYVKQSLKTGDKNYLYNQWYPVFLELNNTYSVNHFTFMDRNRNRILRVHNPEMNDGIVNRYTALEAERTGKFAWGIEIEMGSLEVPTLRGVKPVFEKNELIGFVEFGEDINNLLQDIHKRTGNHLIMTVNKEHLNQKRWEESMYSLGYDSNWNALNNDAIVYSSLRKIPASLNEQLNSAALLSINRNNVLIYDKYNWNISAIKLTNAAGIDIGLIILLVDSTAIIQTFQKTALISGVIIVLFSLGILAFVFTFLKTTERNLTTQQQLIEKSKRDYKALFNSIADSILIFDWNCNFIDCNEFALNLLGYSREEMKNIKPRDIVHPDYHELMRNNLQRLKDGETTLVESVNLNKNGVMIPVEIRSRSINIGDNNAILAVVRNISDRKKLEQNLKLKDNAVQNALTGLAISDTNGIITYINKSFLQLWRYENEVEVLGKNVFEFWQDKENITEIVENLGSKNKWSGERIAKRKDGTTFISQIMANYLTDNDGNPTHFLGSFIDITEKKVADEKLIISEKKYRNFFEKDISGDYLSTHDGRLLDCNPAFVKILGYESKDEMLNINTAEFYVTISDREQFLNDLKKNKHLFNYEFNFRKRDGTIINCIENVYGLFNDEDELVQIQGYLLDITEKKRLQKEIKDYQVHLEHIIEQRTNELINSEEKFRQLVQSTDDIIFTLNSDLVFTGVYGQWLKRYNFSTDFFIGKTVYSVLGFEHTLFHIKQCLLVLKGQSITYEWVFFEEDFKKHIHISLSPLRNDLGKIYGLVGVGRNISKLKEYEEKIETSLKKEIELSDIKSKFLSTASHEFRTPLATILSASQIIRRFYNKWDDQQLFVHFNQIEEEIKKITGLMDEVLMVSKNDDENYKQKLDSVNLKQYIDNSVKNYEILLKTGQKIVLNNNLKNITVMVSNKMLDQVLGNLISNAIKFSDEGKEIKIITNYENNLFFLKVIDNGIGIPENELNKIFEPFYRVNTVENIEGTGLGLNIVQKALTILNGKIQVTSKINQGSIFSVEIPLIKISK